MKDKDRIICDVMMKKGIIKEMHIKDAIEKQKLSGRPLGETLVELGYATEEKIAMALSDEVGIPYVDLDNYAIDNSVLKLFPENLVKELNVIPLFKLENSVTVAMEDPLDIRLADKLRYHSKMDIDPMFATRSSLKRIVDKIYGEKKPSKSVINNILLQREVSTPDQPEISTINLKKSDKIVTAKYKPITSVGGTSKGGKKAVDKGPIEALSAEEKKAVIKITDNIISQAVHNRASDIHLEPDEEKLFLRYRIDGLLYHVPPPPKELEAAIISRIKILANMDIAEKRLPQDGRIKTVVEDNEVDLRVSSFPTIYGENMSIRVLDTSSVLTSFSNVGIPAKTLDNFRIILKRSYGIILATGPTGCGKTTTLYSALREVNRADKNIITLEDPVEYRIPGVRQSQVDPKAGLTFASGLRSIVRQDPDVIFIGEIRDLETAEIAIRSALTGHLVLSTLHTNDAPSALTRLIDMGIEPFLVSSSVVGVIAQRLVRVLCGKCKKSYKPPKELLKSLKLPADKSYKFYAIGGCDDCRGTGYSGRTGIFELMTISEKIKDLILKEPSAIKIREEAVKENMTGLRENGLKKVIEGITTAEEILRVSESEDIGA